VKASAIKADSTTLSAPNGVGNKARGIKPAPQSSYPASPLLQKFVFPSSATPYEVAGLFWKKDFWPVGTEYYSEQWAHGYYVLISQFRALRWNISSRPFSEADRLNGVEWQGQSTLTSIAFRGAKRHSSWEDWATGFVRDVSMKKIKGKW